MQTLPIAFKISRKTPLTSHPQSKDLLIWRVIDKNWFILKSPGLKPNWTFSTPFSLGTNGLMVLESVAWYHSQRDQLEWILFFYVFNYTGQRFVQNEWVFLSPEIILSLSSDKIFSEDFNLPDNKDFTVLQNYLLSLTSFSFRLEK